MDPVDGAIQIFFGGMDVNFDGLLDLMIITSKGAANAYAEYWLFDPKTSGFTELGTYPVFRVDADKKRLDTYESNGSGGMEHEAKEFEFVGGKLTLMRDEKQQATGRRGVFRKVVLERVNGAMKVSSSVVRGQR